MLQVIAGLLACLEDDVGVDALALDVVREADDGGLSDRAMAYERTLDLGGTHAVTGDVDDVVHAAEQPVVAVLVHTGTVPGEVLAGERREVDVSHEFVLGSPHVPRSMPGQGYSMQRRPP
jgi:hypothetical protein